MHLVFRQLQPSVAYIFVCEEFYLFEADDLRADEYVAVRPAMGETGCRNLLLGRNFDHANLRMLHRIGVVVRVNFFHIRFAFLKIQMLHVILLPAVQINCLFVYRCQGARKIHFADNPRLAGNIHDHEVVARHRTQAHRVRRIRFLRPVIKLARAMQISRLRQLRQNFWHLHFAHFVRCFNRQFERRAFQMVQQNLQIVRLNERVLRSIPEKIIRMLHDVLVERRRRRHHHRA